MRVSSNATTMSADEFLSQCDRIGYTYYTDTRHPPSRRGGPSVTLIFPENDENGAAHEKWFELIKQIDDRSPELGHYLLEIGRTQLAYDSVRNGAGSKVGA